MTGLLLYGLLGGFLGTVLMTMFMVTLGDDSPPPTAELWSQYIGSDGPEAYRPQAMFLHFFYGTLAGGVFGVVLPTVVGVSPLSGLVGGLVFGLVLTVIGAVFWIRIVLGLEPSFDKVLRFFMFHFAYGTMLGAIVGIGGL